MTRLSEQPAKKLQKLMHPGEELVAAAQFEYPTSEAGQNQRLSALAKSCGFDAAKDLAYEQRAVYGYAGVSESRPILAKSPVFWNIKPRHVFIDAPLRDCSVFWYDTDDWWAAGRAMLFVAPEGRFAAVSISTRWLGQFGKGQEVALRGIADRIVNAFEGRAQQIPRPGD